MEKDMLYSSIIDFVQEQVNTIAKEQWASDACPPRFLTSIGSDRDNRDAIFLTITHSDASFTETVFPREDAHYGYDSLYDMMKNMYNRTM